MNLSEVIKSSLPKNGSVEDMDKVVRRIQSNLKKAGYVKVK